MRLSDFDYNLPKELIAQYPLTQRENARLLVLDRSKGTIEHRIFKDIIEYLKKGDLLVLNDTKVLASRIEGSRLTGGKVSVLLLRRESGLTFNALIKPSRLKRGEKIKFESGKICAVINAKNKITFQAEDIYSIYKLGSMPLPPYIKRSPLDSDNIYYQTVYARKEGAVAAPTAGLHFSEALIKDIDSGGVNIAYLTLHIGYATFNPVKTDDITKHKMGMEYFEISAETAKLLEETRNNNSRIFAVGTTSMRALETFNLGLRCGYTNLFIYPGYKFNTASCLLTNFHLPRTTLFMLVCAFAGGKLVKKAYSEAVEQRYRFYSYGDVMLII